MIVGIDALRLRGFDRLKGRRVGLLSHQAALTADGSTSAQLLRRSLGRWLVALYGPEHGFFGQALAGEHTYTRPHPDWKIPVYSLYGERRKPSPDMLRGVDVMVCDLQDLGVRCYTYLATLRNMLEACAESGVEVLVADRPVPLPRVVDGPLLDPAFASFVAPCPLPLVYGMSPAESARWMKDALSLPVSLTVSPMEGWSRDAAAWDGARPAYVPPSPGIKTWECAMTYAATVFSEALPGVDCGRGTNLAFRVLGAPWLRAEALCARLAKARLAGVAFHPYRYAAAVAPHAGKELDGVRLTVTDPAGFRPAQASLVILQALAELYGPSRVWRHKGARPEWFDKLYGTDRVRLSLKSGLPLRPLLAGWARDRRDFDRARRRALLYAE